MKNELTETSIQNLEEVDLHFATTEPRPGGRHFIDEQEFRNHQESFDEYDVANFVMRWENLTIEEYKKHAKELQTDSLTMVVAGIKEEIGMEESTVWEPSKDNKISKILQAFPPVGPGQPLISNLVIRSMGPKTAVAVYHRTEADLTGDKFESESALILAKEDGNWKASVFTRRPLPDFGG